MNPPTRQKERRRKWRYISSTYRPPRGQMVFDEEMLQAHPKGAPPVLRFYTFERPTLTLGKLEARRINLEKLAYPYEIRPTGGRAVFHCDQDLCYTLLAGTDDPLVGGTLFESYRKIGRILAGALQTLGRPVELSDSGHQGRGPGHCFSAPTHSELVLDGKKVAGGAQARQGDLILQQGVILLSVAPEWDMIFVGQDSYSDPHTGSGSLARCGEPQTLQEDPGSAVMTGLNDGDRKPVVLPQTVERAIVKAFISTGVRFEIS